VFKNTESFPLMFFDLYLFDMFVKIIPGFVAPDQRHHHDQYQFFQSFLVGHMSVFHVESTAFEGLEKRLHLPSFLVIKHGLGRLVKRYYYQKSRLSIFLNRLCSRHITQNIVDFDDFRTVSKFALFQVVEQPKNRFFSVLFKTKNFEIISYSNIIFDVVFVQKTEPFMPYKLPVGQQTIYFVLAEPFNEFVDQVGPLVGVGIPALVQHFENQWNSLVFVTNAKHQNMVLLSKCRQQVVPLQEQ